MNNPAPVWFQVGAALWAAVVVTLTVVILRGSRRTPRTVHPRNTIGHALKVNGLTSDDLGPFYDTHDTNEGAK